MKYFIAIALIATVASAAVVRPVSSEIAEIQEIIAAINSPSTDPATAAALEQMLFDVLGVKPEPVAVGPAMIESVYEPIAVGPALIDFPLPDGAAVPTPAVVAPVPATSTPLVQIILNINQAEFSPINVDPVVAPEVVEEAPIAVNPIGVVAPEPVQVIEVAPEPVQIIEAIPEPVQIVETAPVAVEPVLIGIPVIPEAAVVLPEELN